MKNLVEQMQAVIPAENLIEYAALEKSGLLYATVKLTPALAMRWRQRAHERQRHLRQTNLSKLRDSVISGSWNSLNGETLKFDTNLVFIDGNHRAENVILTKTPIVCQVVFGCNNNAFLTIDKGATRTLGNSLDVLGFDNSAALAAIAKKAASYKISKWINKCISDVELARFTEENYEQLKKALCLARKSSPIIQMSIGGFLAFEYLKYDEELTNSFFEDFKTVGNSYSNAATILYKTISNQRCTKKSSLSADWVCALSIKAINAYMQGVNIKTLVWQKQERPPLIICKKQPLVELSK
jgi:hypothetical protein